MPRPRIKPSPAGSGVTEPHWPGPISHSFSFLFQIHFAKEHACKCVSAPSSANSPPCGNFCFKCWGTGPCNPHLCTCCFSSRPCHTSSRSVLILLSSCQARPQALSWGSPSDRCPCPVNTTLTVSLGWGACLKFLFPPVINTLRAGTVSSISLRSQRRPPPPPYRQEEVIVVNNPILQKRTWKVQVSQGPCSH